jgi:hypothetical protein
MGGVIVAFAVGMNVAFAVGTNGIDTFSDGSTGTEVISGGPLPISQGLRPERGVGWKSLLHCML